MIPIKIANQYQATSKLSRVLAYEKINCGNDGFACDTGKASIKVKLSGSHTDATLNPFDIAIVDSVMTIIESGVSSFTLLDIYRVVSGDDKASLTEKRAEFTLESLNKLRDTRIEIDCTGEYNLYHRKEKKVSCVYEGYMLSLAEHADRYKKDGPITTVYDIVEDPPLYKYYKMNSQIACVPVECFATQNCFTDSFESIVIKRYIIRKVLAMISNSKISNKISFQWFNRDKGKYEGMYGDLGLCPDSSPKWRKKKEKIMRIIDGTLETLIKQNVIKGYSRYRLHGSNDPSFPVSGYEVTLFKGT